MLQQQSCCVCIFSIFIRLFQNIQDILLVGHRQAVAWLDEWHGQSDSSAALLPPWFSVDNDLNCAPASSSAGLTMDKVREYERTMQEKTNCKVKSSQNAGEAAKGNVFDLQSSCSDKYS